MRREGKAVARDKGRGVNGTVDFYKASKMKHSKPKRGHLAVLRGRSLVSDPLLPPISLPSARFQKNASVFLDVSTHGKLKKAIGC